MSEVGFADDTLLQVRALPDMGERALRIALRKVARVTDKRAALSRAVEAALESFDTQTRTLTLSSAERLRWRTQLCAMLRAFKDSRLALRLRAKAQNIIPASKCKHLDLVVRTRGGNAYGVRFAFLRDAVDSARIGRAALDERREIDGVVIYDLEHSKTRYIERVRLMPVSQR